MKTIISLLFILLLSLAAFGQGKFVPLKESYSSVFDIREFTSVYVLGDEKVEAIKAALRINKSLEFPEEAVDAQFFVKYQKLPTGDEVQVFYLNDKDKDKELVIVWAGKVSKRKGAADLVKEFLEVFERNKRIK